MPPLRTMSMHLRLPRVGIVAATIGDPFDTDEGYRNRSCHRHDRNDEERPATKTTCAMLFCAMGYIKAGISRLHRPGTKATKSVDGVMCAFSIRACVCVWVGCPLAGRDVGRCGLKTGFTHCDIVADTTHFVKSSSRIAASLRANSVFMNDGPCNYF